MFGQAGKEIVQEVSQDTKKGRKKKRHTTPVLLTRKQNIFSGALSIPLVRTGHLFVSVINRCTFSSPHLKKVTLEDRSLLLTPCYDG